VKEVSVSVTFYSPALLEALEVKGFFFGHEVMMLVVELFLQSVVLDGRVKGLLV
jgi:hypothetical protein